MKILKSDNVLVITPHPDDESIGVGGFLSIYGRQTDVMLLTDGRHGNKKNKIEEETLVKLRKKEITEACKLANVRKVIFLEIEDGNVYKYRKKLVAQNIKNYEYVFVPNRFEKHVDHMAVYPIIKKMIRKQHAHCKIIEYEVWTPIRYPNLFLDISKVIENKFSMISMHKTQMEECNFAKKGRCLSEYRGMYCSCDYAEVFEIEEQDLFKKIKRKLPTSIKPKLICILNSFKSRT